jgi:hypothetical protein
VAVGGALIDALADLPSPFVAVTLIVCVPMACSTCVIEAPVPIFFPSSVQTIAALGSVPSTGSLTWAT